DQAKHVAKLGNINLTLEELKVYANQLSQVLDYMDQLSKVNTSDIKPTFQIIDDTVNIFRQDKIKPCLSQKAALSTAEKTYKGYFIADHVFSQSQKRNSTKKILKRKALDKYNAVLTQVDLRGTVGHKDLFVTKGIETTAGSKVLEGYQPQYSATVVKKFEEQGLKTKYKLNQDAWGHGSSGENSGFGPTKNPWDLTRIPGGSSSGSAVAVATQDVDISTGTDTCGSIRMPSHYSNAVGIKPTYGAVSRYGVIAFASSLDCPGLFSNSVSKLQHYFKQIVGADRKDATSQSQLRNKSQKQNVKVIGLPKEFFAKGIDKRVKKSVTTAAKLLKKQGYQLKEITLPHTEYAVAAYYIIAPTETSSNLARYDGVRFGQDRSYFGSEAKRRIMLGSFASSAGYADKYYETAAKIRTLIINDFTKAFKSVDIILGPSAPSPAFKIGAKADNPLEMYLTDVYAAPASLSGLPSLALPCGFTENNLPIGMQLIGSRWSEQALFDLGEKYQQLTDWHTRKPKI
ncbi:Asp-tRNA(Asn)/Glu-tRNA(Gln) amidotransferase subunit GatC, partial [Patescibacteria group bacterium]